MIFSHRRRRPPFPSSASAFLFCQHRKRKPKGFRGTGGHFRHCSRLRENQTKSDGNAESEREKSSRRNCRVAVGYGGGRWLLCSRDVSCDVLTGFWSFSYLVIFTIFPSPASAARCVNRRTETNESPSNGVAPQAPDSERGVSVSIFHFTVFRRRFFLFPFRLANYNESFLQHHHHFGRVFFIGWVLHGNVRQF